MLTLCQPHAADGAAGGGQGRQQRRRGQGTAGGGAGAGHWGCGDGMAGPGARLVGFNLLVMRNYHFLNVIQLALI